MPEYKLEVLIEVALEARGARKWYEDREPRAASAFEAELQQAISLILAAPMRWPVYLLDTRRILLRRFPFFVVYRVKADTVFLVALAHGRRRPGYWRRRLA